MHKFKIYIIFLIFFISSVSFAKEVQFTSEDRERLRNIELRLERLEATMREFKESVDKRFEQVDKRFEQVDKRFEQVDKRFEQTFTFLWILTSIFIAIMVANIGFAYWDRRTIIRKAKEETISEIEKEGRVKDLIRAFREISQKDPEVANILRKFNLL
jgi:predicted PurR-regulated permease PerM